MAAFDGATGLALPAFTGLAALQSLVAIAAFSALRRTANPPVPPANAPAPEGGTPKLMAARTNDIALRAARAAAWEFDLDRSLWILSDAFGDLVGVKFSGMEVKHATWLNYVHGQDFPRVVQHFRDLIEGGIDSINLRFRFVRRGQGLLWLECHGTALPDEIGGRRVFGIVRDVTSEQEMAETLQEAERKIAAATARQQFLAVVSHEVRTPMNGVLGLARLLLDTELTDEQREYAETIVLSGESLLSIINDILDLSKMEANKLTLEPAEFDPVALVDHALSLMAGRAAEKGIVLAATVGAGVPRRATADAARLMQVISNLVGNAIKFTSHGAVVMRVEGGQAADGAKLLVVAVEDTGIGIPEDKQKTLFTEYAQADVSIARRYGGSGLGLAISKRLCEAMGGSVSLRSVPDEGTTITFTIRIDPCETPPAPAARPNRKLLVLEPEARVEAALVSAMEARGIPVVTDLSAADADVATILVSHRAEDARAEALATARRIGAAVAETRLFSSARGEEDGQQFVEPLRSMDLDAIADSVRTPTGASRVTPPRRSGLVLDPLGRRETGIRRLCVLVVEDNPVNQRVASRLIEKHGHEAIIAEHGEAALAVRARREIDVVLMDRHMPVMDGLECTRRWRDAEGEAKRTPIIGLTASVADQDLRECLGAGMDAVLHKPFDPAQLFDEIERLVGGDRPDAPSDAPADGGIPELAAPSPDDSELLKQEGGELDSLRELLGDDEVAELMTAFQSSCASLSSELREAMSAGDGDTARRVAHTIKSSARVMGFNALGAFAESIENVYRGGSAADGRDLDRLAAAMEAVVALKAAPKNVMQGDGVR